jgi:hypothetical protein
LIAKSPAKERRDAESAFGSGWFSETVGASVLPNKNVNMRSQKMRTVLSILVMVSLCTVATAQNDDSAFNHAITDTVTNVTETVNIGRSEILIFHTITIRDSEPSDDQLAFYKVLKIFDSSGGHLLQEIADSGNSDHEIEFVDFNSDGYKDLKIDADMYDLRLPSNVWLFDPKGNRFRYSSDLSGLSELSIGVDGTISTQDLSTGGKGGVYSKYRFDHDTLKLIEEISSNFFDYEKRTLVDGQLVTVEIDASNEGPDGQTTILSKRIVFDSLRVVEKKILKDGDRLDLSNINKGAIIGEPFGTFILIEDSKYGYAKAPDGKLVVHQETRRLVNNRFGTTIKDYVEQ